MDRDQTGIPMGDDGVAMIAVVMNGCFGWFHPASGPVRRRAAIVLCPGLFQDAVYAHLHIRLLASACAARGYPVLRFDYPGCGDFANLGEHEGWAGEHWPAWQQSTHEAADWLKRTAGTSHLVFCGLRFGATLAALASARRDDAAGLILLAPVLRGHSFVRQLSVQASAGGRTVKGVTAGFEVLGLQLSAATLAGIGVVDLRKCAMPAALKVAVFPEGHGATLKECADAWRGGGTEVHLGEFGGLEPLLREATTYEGPPADFAAITGWLDERFPETAEAGEDAAGWDDPPVLHLPGAVETPLRFGHGNGLFGMLCRPAGPATDLAVVITAGGRDPHFGWARSAVALARDFATSGVASLRIDFAGLGDSIGPRPRDKAFSPVFETDRSADIGAAIDKLVELGYRRFAVRGHCVSAYYAFHAAMAEPRISILLLQNMPVLASSTTEDVDLAARKGLTLGDCFRKLGRADTWIRLVHGKAALGLFFRARLALVAERLSRTPAEHDEFGASAARYLKALSLRGVRTLFLFTGDDIGMKVFHRELGKRRFEGAELVVIPGDDHGFARSETQGTVARTMTGFLLAGNEGPRPSAAAANEKLPALSS